MQPRNVKMDLLSDANALARRQFALWQNIVAELDARRIDIEDVRVLVGTADMWTRSGNPSRATAYRMLEQWRATVAEMANPGHGD